MLPSPVQLHRYFGVVGAGSSLQSLVGLLPVADADSGEGPRQWSGHVGNDIPSFRFSGQTSLCQQRQGRTPHRRARHGRMPSVKNWWES
eukprot:4121-Prorocentrum_minimum.AAC.1